MSDPLEALSFEDALKRLEVIVHELEGGEVSLDASIALYTEGEKLRQHCDARLRDAQARIEQMSLGSDGRPTGTRPFDGD